MGFKKVLADFQELDFQFLPFGKCRIVTRTIVFYEVNCIGRSVGIMT